MPDTRPVADVLADAKRHAAMSSRDPLVLELMAWVEAQAKEIAALRTALDVQHRRRHYVHFNGCGVCALLASPEGDTDDHP